MISIIKLSRTPFDIDACLSSQVSVLLRVFVCGDRVDEEEEVAKECCVSMAGLFFALRTLQTLITVADERKMTQKIHVSYSNACIAISQLETLNGAINHSQLYQCIHFHAQTTTQYNCHASSSYYANRQSIDNNNVDKKNSFVREKFPSFHRTNDRLDESRRLLEKKSFIELWMRNVDVQPRRRRPLKKCF